MNMWNRHPLVTISIWDFYFYFIICRSPSFAFSFFFSCLFFLLFELNCFSSFSFLFSGGLVSTVFFLLFLFFFLGAPYFVFLDFGFFFLFHFSGGLVFSLSPSIAWTSRAKKVPNSSWPFPWSSLWFTWNQFVIMPWTTCLSPRYQISFNVT